MSNLLAFPQASVETRTLAAASGAPRPLEPAHSRPSRYPARTAAVSQLAATRSRAAGQLAAAAVPPATPVIDEERLATIAASIGQAAIEVLGGTRPLKQMSHWLDAGCMERLKIRAALVENFRQRASGSTVSRLHRGVSVRSTRLCSVRDGAYEASLVITEQTRVRAIALRLELRRGNWKVTALEIG